MSTKRFICIVIVAVVLMASVAHGEEKPIHKLWDIDLKQCTKTQLVEAIYNHGIRATISDFFIQFEGDESTLIFGYPFLLSAQWHAAMYDNWPANIKLSIGADPDEIMEQQETILSALISKYGDLDIVNVDLYSYGKRFWGYCHWSQKPPMYHKAFEISGEDAVTFSLKDVSTDWLPESNNFTQAIMSMTIGNIQIYVTYYPYFDVQNISIYFWQDYVQNSIVPIPEPIQESKYAVVYQDTGF